MLWVTSRCHRILGLLMLGGIRLKSKIDSCLEFSLSWLLGGPAREVVAGPCRSTQKAAEESCVFTPDRGATPLLKSWLLYLTGDQTERAYCIERLGEYYVRMLVGVKGVI